MSLYISQTNASLPHLYENCLQTLIEKQQTVMDQIQLEQHKARSMQNLIAIIAMVDLDSTSMTVSNVLRDSINKVKEWQADFPITQNSLMTHDQRQDLQQKLFMTVENINNENHIRLIHSSSLSDLIMGIMGTIATSDPMGNLQYTQ